MTKNIKITSDAAGGKRIPIKKLIDIIFALLAASKLPKQQAKIAAHCLVEAEACGNSAHGILALPAHIKKLVSGKYNIDPKFQVIRAGGAFAVIDACNAMGYVSAVHCMNFAIRHCSGAGIFTVFSRNSNTFGPAFYYPLLAAKKGLIGIALCNSPAAMAPWGGKEKLFGTNPVSVAVPCLEADPIILDMSASKAAKSKINEARIKNEQIPPGWALDIDGNPTTDPTQAIAGLMLPIEGYKGYGLAVMIDILSGVLSGAAFMNNVGKFYSKDDNCMNVGQTFIVIDPKQVYGEEFYRLMDDYSNTVTASSKLGQNSVRLPGSSKAANKKDSEKNGIKLAPSSLKMLNECLRECGLDTID